VRELKKSLDDSPNQRLIYSLAMSNIEVKEMSQHIYEQRIMDAWYSYDGPMSFEQFYATYIPA